MKKYLSSILALLIAFGLCSYSVYNAHSRKKGTIYYWMYCANAPFTIEAYETNTNYTLVTEEEYPACDDGAIFECGLQTNSYVSVLGNLRPDFSNGSINFGPYGFPNGGTSFVQNDTQD
jgi:hypothetical protein